jgi:hypothetical protein
MLFQVISNYFKLYQIIFHFLWLSRGFFVPLYHQTCLTIKTNHHAKFYF